MAAPNQHQAVNTTSLSNNYEFICEFRASGVVPVVKYRSKRTGMHILLAKVEGPLVNGYFTVATEAHDDDGLPHTLEHLVFLGSEKYPFKGVLDLLANRCLASGTNAWTDTDHTAYTVQTAGSEGFLNLLPIYLDHLLYPTLTESGFTTEVYHITGEGEDAGVVYSEMQARENSDNDRTYRALLQAMYPEPSGYRSETGGIMKNLRESTSNEKARNYMTIQNYHHTFYRPENLNVIITGQVELEEVFAALEPVEQNILSKGDRGPYTRPWQSPVPPLLNSVDELVQYPSDTEDTGMVIVSWRGPSAVEQVNELLSMGVLMEYLTHSSVSPLPSVFVETEDPLSSSVHHSCYENSISACYFEFSGVPRQKIDDVNPLLMATLTQLATGQTTIDMRIMKDILINLMLRQDSRLETSPHATIADHIIGDVLYGNTCEHLDTRLNKKSWYEHLLKEPCKYWVGLIRKYFIDGPSVVIRGVPSIAEATRLEEEEKRRVETRKLELGDEGLKVWKERVEKAKETNEIPPPGEMLQSVPVPGLESINFHPLRAYANHLETQPNHGQPEPNLPTLLSQLPVKFQLDDLHSNFVEIIAVLDTSAVPAPLRPYLSLLLDLLFESPVVRGNSLIPYEEVVQELAADTLSRETVLGLSLHSRKFSCASYCTNAAVILKTEMSKYEKGVQWMHDILFKSRFTTQRVKVKANKLVNSIGESKRSGPTLLQLMFHGVAFRNDSNQNQQNILRQEKFLNYILNRLNTEEEKVLGELEQVRSAIVHKDRITIHMATDVEKLSTLGDPLAPWLNFVSKKETPKERLLNIIPDSELLSHENLGNITGFLTGVGSVESAYLLQSTSCVTEHRDWDVPAILTAIQYLTQLEGPMWREIRGQGLAYSYSINLNPTQGLLILKLARAAQLTGAYREAQDILNSHINGTAPWDLNLLESARSSLIFEIIEREAVISDVVQQSLLAYFRRVPHSYNKYGHKLRVIDSLEDSRFA
ncbi:Peptidase M16 inactive domain and insulinase-containing protein [Homarus americanus]|uniref:Peptidase M16 inactive domain and insulinase-containing protein n=1 Tax=Homarus americanus TaxID=6706 RepID=A0A8J5N7X9_HOMAM|nr:Peptidase M16 inactive domain and insulinase-containing protein [Homarus americanus]